MIKAILFDLGGVIYRQPSNVSANVISAIFNVPLEIARNLYLKNKRQYFSGKISTDEFIDIFSKEFKTKLKLGEIKKIWLKTYPTLIKPDEKILSIISSLRKNYKVYLFTNTLPLNDEHNRTTKIYSYFDKIIKSFEMGFAKPDIEAYKKALEIIGFKGEECIFIDDKEENLLPAKNLGIKTILFNITKDKTKKLKKEVFNILKHCK